jgi:hypothetical protein
MIKNFCILFFFFVLISCSSTIDKKEEPKSEDMGGLNMGTFELPLNLR